MATQTGDRFRREGDMNVSELQKDLQRKYRNVGGRVQEIWREFTPKEREKAMRGATGDGKVLRHSLDSGMGDIKRFIPDFNKKDITSTADFFLDRLKFRVEIELVHQLYEGVNGGPGDRETVYAGAQTIDVSQYGDFAAFHKLDKDYGRFVTCRDEETRRTVQELGARTGMVLPVNEAYSVLLRQQLTFVYYNHIIEEILEMGSKSRVKSDSSARPPAKETADALALLTLSPQPLKSSIAQIACQAMEHKLALEHYLELLQSEPVVLHHAVQSSNQSRPEHVPDRKGRILPLFIDKYMSISFFEVMNDAVRAIVTWEYIVSLIRTLEADGTDDKTKRSLVLQELSNVCNSEYLRAQSAFRRQMSSHSNSTGVAAKCFRRITTNDVSRIEIKGQPADHTVSSPQLHYVLRLCHPDTKYTDAVQWMKKLDDHNTRHPDDFQRLTKDQVFALGDLAIIISFMHTLSTSLPIVSGSKKSGVLFVGRTSDLDTRLTQYKAKADFGDHLVPAGNLLEPGVARKALKALDEFILEQAGARLGMLYEDLLHHCLNDVEKKYSVARVRLEKAEEQQQPHVPLPVLEERKPASVRVEEQTQKFKTRRADEATTNDIPATEHMPLEGGLEVAPRLDVKASTALVFSTMFAKAHARGSVPWAGFAGAMADVGFSVTPKGGSIFTFNPPESMGATRSVTLHRPHVSDIEGYLLLIYSKRLHKTYGWTEETFVVK